MPDFAIEARHGAQRGRVVVGIDEAGRGPWAGPVVAAAAWLHPSRLSAELRHGLDDSKKLSGAARERLYSLMAASPPDSLRLGLGHAEVAEIDRLNILQATFLAMARALADIGVTPDVALVDGNQAPDLGCAVETVVKGDARCLSIAAASIAAKVARDRHMSELARAHPGFGWERNRGYGTAEHQAALLRLGVTPEHRRSFRPIREALSINL